MFETGAENSVVMFCVLSTGNVDLSDLLSSMDDQIAKAKEQALSRKDILEKVEKWKHASGEEIWLDEYEMVNRFIGSILWIGLWPCLLFNARVVDGFF